MHLSLINHQPIINQIITSSLWSFKLPTGYFPKMITRIKTLLQNYLRSRLKPIIDPSLGTMMFCGDIGCKKLFYKTRGTLMAPDRILRHVNAIIIPCRDNINNVIFSIWLCPLSFNFQLVGKKAWIGIFNIVDSLFLSTPTFTTSKILMIFDCTQEGNMEKGLSIILVLTEKI